MLEFWNLGLVLAFAIGFCIQDLRELAVPNWFFMVFNWLGVIVNSGYFFAEPILLVGNLILMGAFNYFGWKLDEKEFIGQADLMFVGTLFLLLPFPRFAVDLWGLPMAVPIVAFVIAGAFYSVVRWFEGGYCVAGVGRKVALGPFLLSGAIVSLLAIVF